MQKAILSGGVASIVIVAGAIAVFYTPISNVLQLPGTGATTSCLVEVSSDAILTGSANQTAVGVTVGYSNGTKKFFPEGSCPQPAQPSTYSLAMAVEKDPRFTQMEKGRQYVLESARVDGKEYFNNTMHDLVIFGWFNNTSYYPCSHTFVARWQLGQIQAFIPVMQDGSLNMKGLMLDLLTESQLNTWSCPGA